MTCPPFSLCVHSLSEARQALAFASRCQRTAVLLSPAECLYTHGAAWFPALCRQAALDYPAADYHVVVDCADAPGYALAALDAGAPALLLARMPIPARETITAIALQMGRHVYHSLSFPKMDAHHGKSQS